MSLKLFPAVVSALYSVAHAQNIPSCGVGKDPCPEEYPCCSTDGTCGNGYVCLGGCDPRYSYEPGACAAMPVCKSGTWNFTSSDDVTPYSDYLGDAEKSPWSYLGNITAVDGKLRTQMFKNSGGSSVSSSNYVWYGKVTVNMKTSHGGGVVSDAILLSNVKDEIDFESIGNQLTAPQTNYYWQGALNYSNEISGQTSDTYQNYHSYTFDWQEDRIQWSIDGNVVRTLNKQDTYNSTSQSYSYPQTPARIQFGIWPAGDSSAQGTIEWAGGTINWNSADMQDPGYYYAEFTSVEVECYDPPSGTQTNGSSAYVYTSKDGLSSDIAITDDDTILGSTDGTGLKPNGSLTESSSSSSSIQASSTTSQASSSSSVSSGSASSQVTSSSTLRTSSSAADSSASSGSNSGDTAASTLSGSSLVTSSVSSSAGLASSSASGSDSSSVSSASATSDSVSNAASILAIPIIGALVPLFLP